MSKIALQRRAKMMRNAVTVKPPARNGQDIRCWRCGNPIGFGSLPGRTKAAVIAAHEAECLERSKRHAEAKRGHVPPTR